MSYKYVLVSVCYWDVISLSNRPWITIKKFTTENIPTGT